MLDDLDDDAALRRLYTDPADYVDSDHPSVHAFAQAAAAGAVDDKTRAVRLFAAVRDRIRYNPYVDMRAPRTFRASSVLEAGEGYCVGKAALYAAALRSLGTPARVGFADVRNHLSSPKLLESMGTDLFAWHGFTEIWLDGAWRKASPTFNAALCSKLGVDTLDFDGERDALLHPYDGVGRAYMRYERQHGAFFDVPVKFLAREMARVYPQLTAGSAGDDRPPERDMMRENDAAGAR